MEEEKKGTEEWVKGRRKGTEDFKNVNRRKKMKKKKSAVEDKEMKTKECMKNIVTLLP